MIYIILLVLLLLVLWPVIKIGYHIYRAQRQMRKAYEQASRQQQQQQEAEREKIFDRNVGEYVDFEEIENTDNNSEPHYNPTVKIEPQIEDAEWEDIK